MVGMRIGVAAAATLVALTAPSVSGSVSHAVPAARAAADSAARSVSHSACAATRPSRFRRATGTTSRRGNLRVVGIQYEQAVANVTSYARFRHTMRCLMNEFVVPHEREGEKTLVVFNEDIGLETLAEGSRGAATRSFATSRAAAPDGDGLPAGASNGLAMLNAAYSPQIAAYQSMFGPIASGKQVFVGATDTFARAFSQTFSALARDYGVYVVASNNQARYRETHDPTEVATFGDPDIPHNTTAFVATSPKVYNTTFLWGPHTVHRAAPSGERNLLFRNEKVPLTSLESGFLDLDAGPATGAAARRNAAGHVVAGHRLGFATSLPAFEYGYPFGKRPKGFRPCADLSVSYMPCMNHLGVDTVIQAEANPGRWAGNGGNDDWQPLDWMGSAWRAVADPTVHFRYAVNPMMVGNLFDLDFDGQSAILSRHHRGSPRHYVGDAALHPSDGDPRNAKPYVGGKRQFMALAPWVRHDSTRAALRAEGQRLSAGSGDRQQGDYLETAVYADLLPVHHHRPRHH